MLVQLAMADNIFTDSEKDAIRRIGESYGISADEVEEIIVAPNLKTSLAPMTVTKKMDFLIDSMVVLLADHEIHESEDIFVKALARRLGFEEQVITFLMDYHTMDRVPLKDMMLKYMVH